VCDSDSQLPLPLTHPGPASHGIAGGKCGQRPREVCDVLKCGNMSERYVCGVLKCGNVSKRYLCSMWPMSLERYVCGMF